MNKLIIILDANVIISAFLFSKSRPRQLLEIAKNNHLIILSESIIQELTEVLHHPKFDRYLTLDIRKELLNTLIEASLIIQPDIIIKECRDSKDNKYLELAVSGKAGFFQHKR